MAGDQDELGVGQVLGVVEQLHAAAVGQHQVEQDDVGLLQGHLPARVAQRPGSRHREAFVGDQHRHRFRGVGVVIDEQGVRHSKSSGKKSVWHHKMTALGVTRGRVPPATKSRLESVPLTH